MRLQPSRKNLCFLAAAFALCWTGRVVADDISDARRLIEQAIAAQGGMKGLEQIGATFLATKGVIYALREAAPFTSEEFYQAPDRYRQVANFDTDGFRIRLEDVLDSDKGWHRDDLGTKPLTGDDFKELKTKVYVNHVASLYPCCASKDSL